MRTCPTCGRALPQTERHCAICAAAMAAPPVAPPVAPPIAPPPVAPPKRPPYWIFAIAGLLIVIVVMGAVLYSVITDGLPWERNEKKDKSKDDTDDTHLAQHSVAKCPNCDAEYPKGSAYCNECGTDLKADPKGGGDKDPGAEGAEDDRRVTAQAGDPVRVTEEPVEIVQIENEEEDPGGIGEEPEGVAREEPEETEPYELYAKGPYDSEGFSVSNGIRTYSYDGVEGIACIDVSVHQGTIDWNAVAAAGIEAAIIQVGYRGYGGGTILIDDNFYTNIEGALAAGLDVGVYFFSQAITEEEAIAEAEYTMDLIASYPITYPVLFTWEQIAEGRTATMTRTQGTDFALAFCSAVEEKGYRSGVYFNTDWVDERYEMYRLHDYLSWGAWWYADQTAFYYDFTIWQYTETGTVPGVAGNVDLNIIFTNQ